MQQTQKRPASLWHNRNYLLLLGGQIVSSIGTQVSQLAFPLLVLLLTRSAAQAGIVGALRTLPYFFLSLPAGALVDRWDRKRLMIACDAIRAICLGSIPVAFALGNLALPQIYLVSLLEGTFFVFFDLAQTSSLPIVVAQEQLPTAVAQNQTTQGITSLLGPSLGGLLFSVAALLPFLADALSYAASVLSLSLIRINFQQQRTIGPQQLLPEVIEGLQWFWQQPLVRVMAVFSGGVNLVVGGGSSLLVIVLAQHLHASTFLIGLIFACGGGGYILGSLVAPFLQRRFSFGQVIIGCSWLSALLWPLYAVVPNIGTLGILTAFIFFLGPIFNVVNASYRLALVPDALQGRVNSAVRLISYATLPLGLAATGILIQTNGTGVTILCGAGVLLLVALIATLSRHVRHAPRINGSGARSIDRLDAMPTAPDDAM